ncbi:MAG TPA: triphosphoribosyl-dephospho-CoA synthase [Methanobacterium sp.]|jgi:triphosphoribosyl-dephospho-CoA synthase|nr:MAG: ATP--dephospho-CoA triphosphoribosyl transferase CitG [Methanobacterium sp.]HOI71425.1 triphosphoribosyl-dephospho-CoA synthase [Methanobacterium sp.]HPX78401.1 triphosphoribosyl-dephospho-CoA synthase [Methanobacterium sp.]
MDPSLTSKIAQLASVLEVSGHPKPGNVHRTQDFEDMVFEDFLISGIAIGNTMEKAARQGLKYQDQLHKIHLGKLIKEAVLETFRWVENNTNLGIIMLLTPLSAAAGNVNDFHGLRGKVHDMMLATTSQDAVDLYDAINIADAGGMGQREDLDVGSENAREELMEKNINMFHVLEISSSWDALAYELTHKMPVSFTLGYPTYKKLKKAHGNNMATVQTFLTILASKQDTLISRKYDQSVSARVKADAKIILDKGGILTEEGRSLIEKFDQDLMKNKYNPGTTADLTASSLMIALLEEFWE